MNWLSDDGFDLDAVLAWQPEPMTAAEGIALSEAMTAGIREGLANPDPAAQEFGRHLRLIASGAYDPSGFAPFVSPDPGEVEALDGEQ